MTYYSKSTYYNVKNTSMKNNIEIYHFINAFLICSFINILCQYQLFEIIKHMHFRNKTMVLNYYVLIPVPIVV